MTSACLLYPQNLSTFHPRFPPTAPDQGSMGRPRGVSAPFHQPIHPITTFLLPNLGLSRSNGS
jgi:hypothetical protein